MSEHLTPVDFVLSVVQTMVAVLPYAIALWVWVTRKIKGERRAWNEELDKALDRVTQAQLDAYGEVKGELLARREEFDKIASELREKEQVKHEFATEREKLRAYVELLRGLAEHKGFDAATFQAELLLDERVTKALQQYHRDLRDIDEYDRTGLGAEQLDQELDASRFTLRRRIVKIGRQELLGEAPEAEETLSV